MDDYINIGRMERDELGQVQNDIILLPDIKISRFHCRIDISEGFKKYELLPDTWVSLLMMNHYRLGVNVIVPNLSNIMLINILSYIGKKRQFSLVDCGSILGTYIKIKMNVFQIISKDQIFSLGTDLLITVREVLDYEILAQENAMSSYMKDELSNNTEIRGNYNTDGEGINEESENGLFPTRYL